MAQRERSHIFGPLRTPREGTAGDSRRRQQRSGMSLICLVLQAVLTLMQLWNVENNGEERKVTYLSTLVKHTQAVNVVRWCPRGLWRLYTCQRYRC
jgi:hypothetical protein